MKLYDDMILTGNRVIGKSYAKINLTLDVLGRLENGYHEVEMIMQTLSLFDLLIMDKLTSGISLKNNLKYLPNNEKNIAYKAAALFFETTGIEGGVKIMIHKNIPVAAGLAGGSGNAGAVLCALNLLYNHPLEDAQLLALGKQLGADVPYCMQGGTQLCQGIGEKLTSLPALPKLTLLLVKPPINVSTPVIYEKLDEVHTAVHPDTAGMIAAIEKKNSQEIAQKLCNVMEPVTQGLYPVIGGIKEKMLKNGALNAVMSGSGPTVFGIFSDRKKAKESADSFARLYKDVFLCTTLN